MVQYTDQQRRAIEARDFSVGLSAGAGCGKTFVLTQRFLRELEPRPGETVDLNGLVAITFTDRAAREMRERVRRTCRERLAHCPDAEVAHWQQIVRDLDTARISTIHSFCSTLLRAHAIEVGIDPQSRLFDEITGTTFRQKVIREELRTLLVEGHPDARAVVGDLGWELTRDRIAELVPQRYRLEPAEWVNRTPAQLVALWKKVLETDALPPLLQQFQQSATVDRVLRLVSGPQSSHAKMRERCAFLARNLPLIGQTRSPQLDLEKLAEHAKVQGGGTAQNWPDPDLHDEAKAAFTDLRDDIKDLLKPFKHDDIAGALAAELSLAALRLTVEIGARYDERKRAEGWLDFDDLLIMARNLLRDQSTVRQKVGRGIRLLMVDEFQDTDRLQAEIVRHICGDELTTGKLFLVGDIKQSIYRFRRAEPQVFRQLRGELPKPGQLPLTGNFRSQPAILQFVNALCDGALGDEYEALSAQTPQLSTTPCIEFLFPLASLDAGAEASEEEAGPAAGGAGEEELRAPEKRSLEARWIALRTRELLEDRAPRVRERDPAAPGGFSLRRVEPRDIVLLFRAMNDVGLYENALREQGVPHYVVGGKAFYAQQEVYDVANLLRVLDEPDDLVALVGVLRSPWFALSDDEIFAAGLAGLIEPVAARVTRLQESSPEAAHPSPAPPSPQRGAESDRRLAGVEQALRVLAELRTQVARCSLMELLQLAIDKTGFDAALLTEFLGERKLANLQKLVEQARARDLAGQPNLSEFANQLLAAVVEESRESLAAIHPESGNVVRLMTIHQSKGLEFPVVFVADMNRRSRSGLEGARLDDRLGPLLPLPPRFSRTRPNPGRDVLALLEQPEELFETQRLLYVATTRAADLLILSGTLEEKEGRLKLEHPWMNLLASRFDLQTGQPSQSPENPVLLRHGRELPEIRVHHQSPQGSAGAQASRAAGTGLIPWLERLDDTPPGELPAELREFSPDPRARRRFSVSSLENLLEACAPGERPPEADWSDLLERVQVDWPRDASPTSPYHPGAGLAEGEATLLGTLVHKVLELGGGDPRESLRRVFQSLLLPVSPRLRELAEECLATIMSDPGFAPIRALPGEAREVEFQLQRGTPEFPCWVIGKIDAILREPTGWRVIDFKTGHVATRRDFALTTLNKYALQLGVYSLAIADWTGQLPGPLELVWLPRGERLRFQPDRPFLDRIGRLLDWCLARARQPGALEAERVRDLPAETLEEDLWAPDRG